jgi:hypothetical protein
MQSLFIEPTSISPEIHFSTEKNIFLIRGNSSPEDVRALYYPVIEWIKNFIDELIEGKSRHLDKTNPIRLQIDLQYFNSSSAKFLYDIFIEIKRLISSSVPFVVEWYYEEEDLDQKEAGADIALLAGMDFIFIAKNK